MVLPSIASRQGLSEPGDRLVPASPKDLPILPCPPALGGAGVLPHVGADIQAQVFVQQRAASRTPYGFLSSLRSQRVAVSDSSFTWRHEWLFTA